jgi:hypothetical protein
LFVLACAKKIYRIFSVLISEKSMKYLLILPILLLSGYNHLFAHSNYMGAHSTIKNFELSEYVSSGIAEVRCTSLFKSSPILSKGQNESLNESPLEIEEEEDADELASGSMHLEGHIYAISSLPHRLRSYQDFSSIISCRYILFQVFRI